jgi:diacylglycerol kinase (ATP)
MQIKLEESVNTTTVQSDMATKMSISQPLERSSQQRAKAWRVATSIGVSFKYAAAGVTYAFNTQ